MSRQGHYRLLNECVRNGLIWIELHGYQWFRREFRRAIDALEQSPRTERNRRLLANSYCLLGDLYFVIGAPCAYIKSYVRALQLCPSRRGLLRECAEVVSMMEQSKESAKCESLLHHVAKEIGTSVSSVTTIERMSQYAFVSGDAAWMACESLAQLQPRSALRLVEAKRGIRMRQLRMMAWGAMDNAEVVMQEWSRIVESTGTIDLGIGDWFFLPASLWESPEFWENLLRIVGRISNLGLYSPNSETQGPPELLACPFRTQWTQVYRHAIKFHLARTCGDARTLRRMCNKFPKWPDPHATLLWLQSANSPPTRDDMLGVRWMSMMVSCPDPTCVKKVRKGVLVQQPLTTNTKENRTPNQSDGKTRKSEI